MAFYHHCYYIQDNEIVMNAQGEQAERNQNVSTQNNFIYIRKLESPQKKGHSSSKTSFVGVIRCVFHLLCFTQYSCFDLLFTVMLCLLSKEKEQK